MNALLIIAFTCAVYALPAPNTKRFLSVSEGETCTPEKWRADAYCTGNNGTEIGSFSGSVDECAALVKEKCAYTYRFNYRPDLCQCTDDCPKLKDSGMGTAIYTLTCTGPECSDSPCNSNGGSTTCSVNAIPITCAATSSSKSFTMQYRERVLVATIPAGTQNLVITINALNDLDVNLKTLDGRCLAGYRCAIDCAPGHGGCEDNLPEGDDAMNIYFSGDDRDNNVTETITVSGKSTVPLNIFLDPYFSGDGTITWSWDGIDPCPPDLVGSRSCSCVNSNEIYSEAHGCNTLAPTTSAPTTSWPTRDVCAGFLEPVNSTECPQFGPLGTTDHYYGKTYHNADMYDDYNEMPHNQMFGKEHADYDMGYPNCDGSGRVDNLAEGEYCECDPNVGNSGCDHTINNCQNSKFWKFDIYVKRCSTAESDIDCEGSWSSCTAACEMSNERVWTETQKKSGNGKECPAAVDCMPGDGACPADIDCEGSWSTCTTACETSAQRTFTTTVTQSGNGKVCPAAVNCMPGDGGCVAACSDSGATYKRIGCYKDVVRDRALSRFEFVDYNRVKTVDDCFQDCQAGGYYYTGFQWQRQCFCGMANENVMKYGIADNCKNGKGGLENGAATAAFDLYVVDLPACDDACLDVKPPTWWANNSCAKLKAAGKCPKIVKEHSMYCKKTCGMCGAEPLATHPPTPVCYDLEPPAWWTNNSCAKQKDSGKCAKRQDENSMYCRKTCGMCS